MLKTVYALFFFIVANLVMMTPVAHAQWSTQFDQAGARESRESGVKVKLADILSSLKRDYGGYHTKAELFSTPEGGLEYRIDWLSGDGRVLFIKVDAKSGAVVSVEGSV